MLEQENQIFAPTFILGISMAALFSVQTELIQGREKEALTIANEAIRKLKELVDKHIYKLPQGEQSNDANQG